MEFAPPVPPIAVLLLLAGTAVSCHAEAETVAAHPCTGAGRIAQVPWAFFGYACAGACAEHKAGFAWAERNGISHAAACNGPTPAFVEGCRTYSESIVTAEQAGFEWARENEVSDTCACAGAGPRFEAGCEAYLEFTTRPD